jgi:hypothetical protein
MVATAAPFGMIPARRIGSGYNTQGFTRYKIASGYATNIFFGDVVKLVADGVVEKDVGTTTLTPVGVFLGCEYTGAGGLNYRLHGQLYPANTVDDNIIAYVLDDPDAEFLMQGDGSVPQTAVGANAAIVQTAGTVKFGKSKNALDVSSINTTSTLPLRITGFGLGTDGTSINEPGDSFTNVRVKFNNHQLRTLAGV